MSGNKPQPEPTFVDQNLLMQYGITGSHSLNQCWPKSLVPYGVTKSDWPPNLFVSAFHFQYLQDVGCPITRDESGAYLDWLLGFAVRLEYGDQGRLCWLVHYMPNYMYFGRKINAMWG